MTPETRERLELEAKSAIAWLFSDRRYTNVDEGVFYSPENLSLDQIKRVDMVFDALAPIIDEMVGAEREACAKVADAEGARAGKLGPDYVVQLGTSGLISERIRNRA